MPTPRDFIDDLKVHDLFHQATDEAGLRKHLATGKRRGYAGFDPTADSFTIGNMVPMMLLAHLQRAGHTPVILSGGGTGLIGDPSGKSAERTLMTEETVRANVEAQKKIFSKVIDFDDKANPPIIVNNHDWLGKLGYLEVLRDVGKHFSVNMMIQKDSVKSRLESRDQGISYTEFSYMILQAFDFAHLHKSMGVTLQMGGSDQWGNIVAGGDLIRRLERQRFEDSPQGREHQSRNREALDAGTEFESILVDRDPAFGLTCPLITKADGGKFGKSEKGAVWMTADRTSPYAFYQFWLNAADADIPRFLRTFTFLSADELNSILAAHAGNPGAREAHRTLARTVTEMIHGKTEMDAAEAAAKALFSGEIGSLPEATLAEIFAEVPSSQHSKAALEGDGVPILDILVSTALAASKREAKEFLQNGSVSVNGSKVGPDDRLKTAHLLHGHTIAIRRGKKNWHVVRFG
jgi:tyrosyl-tRNA synthetase